MDARSLETLLWIARLGGVGAAARHLNLTQPAITRRVRGLEQELGTQVLRREGRGIALTQSGRDCLAVAERMIADFAALRIAAGGAGAIAGPLRIGMGEVIALTWIDRLLGRIAHAYPRLVPELHVDLSGPLLHKLAAREIDIALVPGPVTVRGAVASPLGHCTLRWMAPPRLVPADTSVTPADLAGLPILAMPPESDIHGVMQAWFQRAGTTPRRLSHCNSFNVLVSLVRKGLGVSLMPEELLGRFISTGELAVLSEHPLMPMASYTAAYMSRDDLPVLAQIASFAREAAALPGAWRDASALE
ncbi:MAG: LysR family transcriptional regulator [Proteobacteria bacterium]|nr:LysR family transcriptional regulator [Pseudomonadota bacterium]